METKLYAFVLMPFDKKYNDVYRLGIQEASRAVNIRAERLDDQIFDGNMLEKIYKEIDMADLVIADMSDRNPNVFYEVGYSDARKKLILLLTNNKDDIPFDLLHRPHIIYDSISNLKAELIERLEWAKTEVIKRSTEPIELIVKTKYSTIDREKFSDTAVVSFTIEIHNLSEKPITNIHSFFIYSGSGWSMFFDNKLCKSSESDFKPYTQRHYLKPDFSIIPAKDWLPLDYEMKKTVYTSWKKEDERKDKYQLTGILRVDVHTDTTAYKKEFTINTIAEFEDLPF